jgi:hypothetical protein
MRRNVRGSLTGVSSSNLHVLIKQGNSNQCSGQIPAEVVKIKATIMRVIIIPSLAKNWKVLEENLIFFDSIQAKLTKLISKYPCLGLNLYVDLMNAFQTSVFMQIEIASLENKLYGSDCSTVTTLLFKTVMIRLKPELEFYNLVLGKPNLSAGEKYNTAVINDILLMLDVQNVTFEQMKNFITTKYTPV